MRVDGDGWVGEGGWSRAGEGGGFGAATGTACLRGRRCVSLRAQPANPCPRSRALSQVRVLENFKKKTAKKRKAEREKKRRLKAKVAGGGKVKIGITSGGGAAGGGGVAAKLGNNRGGGGGAGSGSDSGGDEEEEAAREAAEEAAEDAGDEFFMALRQRERKAAMAKAAREKCRFDGPVAQFEALRAKGGAAEEDAYLKELRNGPTHHANQTPGENKGKKGFDMEREQDEGVEDYLKRQKQMAKAKRAEEKREKKKAEKDARAAALDAKRRGQKDFLYPHGEACFCGCRRMAMEGKRKKELGISYVLNHGKWVREEPGLCVVQ